MGLWDDAKFHSEIEKGSKNPENIKFKSFNIEADGMGVKFTGEEKTYSLDEIRSLFPQQRNTDYSVLVFWDDFAQYTGLGMLDKINTELYKDDDFTYGTISYLQRRNELVNTIDVVYETLLFYKEFRLNELEEYIEWKGITDEALKNKMRDIHKKRYTVSKEDLTTFYKNNYFDILRYSPYNGIFISVLQALNNFSRIGFVFKYDFYEKNQLIKEINEKFNFKKKCTFFSYVEEGNSIDNILLDFSPNVIFSTNAGRVWEAILRTNLQQIEIFTNEIHDGLSDEFLILLNELSDGHIGPNKCRIYTYNDTIAINMPSEKDSKI